MKMFCKENHWFIKDGRLILLAGRKKQEDQIIRMEAALEAKIRLQIYDDICNYKFTDNRKAITKAGIENVALTVQSMCADMALGKSK